MKKLSNLICILGVAISLTACSYFNTGEDQPVDVSTQQPQQIDLTTGQEIIAQPLAPVEFNDVAHVIQQSSDGRVQIFPLDDEPVNDTAPQNQSMNDSMEVQPVDAVPLYAQNTVNPYPGVEVFPLDDAMAAITSPRTLDIRTPSNNGPVSLTPFPTADNNGMQTGGDFVAMAVPGGAPTMIYFAHDSVTLNQSDLATLSSLADSYKSGALSQDISVAGHASVQSSISDPVQRKIINLKISMDRAFAVARALIESGIPPERIETKAFGETRPPAPSDKPVEVASRRVEIFGVSVQ
jgi:outer membrane protein OmpA-like peptidoglycan-associated protein